MATAVAFVSSPLGAGRATLLVALSLLLHALVVAALRERLVQAVPEPASRLRTIEVALVPETPREALAAPPPAPTRDGVTGKPPRRAPARAQPFPEANAPRASVGRPERPAAGEREAAPAATPGAGPALHPSVPAAGDADVAFAQSDAATLAANLAMELGELGGALAAFPASASYEYRMSDSRNPAGSGTTAIDWKIDPSTRRYEAQLRSTAFGVAEVDLSSAGSVQRFGLAPERYVHKSGTRAVQAANVDWRRHVVTFSARSAERPAREGLQDRLSFQFQLMALGQQLPSAFRTGATVAMEVAGTGDVDLYRFVVVGPETVTTGVGPIETIKLDRPRVRPADLRVEAWLAPSRRYLPVRLRFTDPRGNVTENLLESVREGP